MSWTCRRAGSSVAVRMPATAIRALGDHGPAVFPLGLGAMSFSDVYGPSNDREAIATIRAALELGVTLLDTADAYGRGANEELVGRAIAARRDDVALATKFGLVFEGNGVGVNGRPEHVRASIEASLRRLDVETVDLCFLHRVDPDTPIEETVGAMAELVSEGKVRHLGLSEPAARPCAGRTQSIRSRRLNRSTRCSPAILRPWSCRPVLSSGSASSLTVRSDAAGLPGG